jgi:hypothetical protein
VTRPKGSDKGRGKRSRDPVTLGDIVDGLLAEEVFSRGLPVAELASRWPEIVGPRLAAATGPLSLEGGVLSVGVSTGVWGAQARFLHEEIRRKADEALGGGRVTDIRIIVRNPS